MVHRHGSAHARRMLLISSRWLWRDCGRVRRSGTRCAHPNVIHVRTVLRRSAGGNSPQGMVAGTGRLLQPHVGFPEALRGCRIAELKLDALLLAGKEIAAILAGRAQPTGLAASPGRWRVSCPVSRRRSCAQCRTPGTVSWSTPVRSRAAGWSGACRRRREPGPRCRPPGSPVPPARRATARSGCPAASADGGFAE